jgi:hypothetical protein
MLGEATLNQDKDAYSVGHPFLGDILLTYELPRSNDFVRLESLTYGYIFSFVGHPFMGDILIVKLY